MTLGSYPSIYNLGHAEVVDIFSKPVRIDEKVDGSQFSFGVRDGRLLFRSKGAAINPDVPPTMFKRAVTEIQQLHANKPFLEGWTWRGECIDKPKHNTLEYSRVPAHNVIIFDIDEVIDRYMAYDDLAAEASEHNLEVVPLLYSGTINSAEDIKRFLEQESGLGGPKIEGVVIKPIEPIYGRDRRFLLAKYVSEAFKETHKVDYKSRNPSGSDFVLQLAASLSTEARWRKSVEHLRDADKLQNAPQDIGPLMKEVNMDVLKEEEGAIKEALFKHFWPSIARRITDGLPEWYKQALLNSQFE